MGRPNKHGLPPYLRKGEHGYFLDYWVKEGDVRRRVRESLAGMNQLQALAACSRKTQQLAQAEQLGYDPGYLLSKSLADYRAHSLLRHKRSENERAKAQHILAVLGDQPLRMLNHASLDELVASLKQAGPSGKPLKNATVNRYLVLIKAASRFAQMNQRIPRDPFRGYRRLRENNQRNRVLNREEFQRLHDSAPPHLRPVLVLAYRLGLRLGELLGLTWDRVDLGEGALRLEQVDTKTGQARQVPLGPDLVALLKSLPRCPGSRRVFLYWRPRRGGEVPAQLKLGPRTEMRDVKSAFNNAVRKAGIQDFRFHDLRHCAITNLRRAGVDVMTVMALSGHRTTEVFRRYNTVDMDDLRRALGKLEA